VQRHTDVLFAVAGSGPVRQQLVDGFARLGLRAHLLLLGDLDYATAGRFMAECDVLLYLADDSPRNNMQSPLKVYHYLATGVPTVATKLPVVSQFAGSGLITVSAEGVAELEAAVLDALALDSVERERLGAQHRAFIVENFTWAHTVDLVESVLLSAHSRVTDATT
jgi:glycosyltransferase involved in cell wall biosynthesis